MEVVDVDAKMEHEAKQQELIDDIMQRLHRATADHHEYHLTFGLLAGEVIRALYDESCFKMLNESTTDEMTLVFIPVGRFTSDERERKFLLARVLDRLVGSFTTPCRQSYDRNQLVVED